MDEPAETVRDSATTIVGTSGAVDRFIAGREVLHREGLGGLASVTVGRLDREDRVAAAAAGLELAPVSLQQLIVRKTNVASTEFGDRS
jgi:ABC-2 type transport system ATP-binding protein